MYNYQSHTLLISQSLRRMVCNRMALKDQSLELQQNNCYPGTTSILSEVEQAHVEYYSFLYKLQRKVKNGHSFSQQAYFSKLSRTFFRKCLVH